MGTFTIIYKTSQSIVEVITPKKKAMISSWIIYFLWVLAFLQGFIIDILGKFYVLVNDIGNIFKYP
jgi:hypothetical protein